MGAQFEAPRFLKREPLDSWEYAWASYDQQTYDIVLGLIRPEDHILEIGAGDLRLALQMASKAEVVYACEIQERLIQSGIRSARNILPKNLSIIQGDARYVQFPDGITIGVLLMRHCNHFWLYAQKLIQVGCSRLITNARWRISVEEINLLAPRVNFDTLHSGWYACLCGATGFKSRPIQEMQFETLSKIFEVKHCPACASLGR